jgi:hypothetical protein
MAAGRRSAPGGGGRPGGEAPRRLGGAAVARSRTDEKARTRVLMLLGPKRGSRLRGGLGTFGYVCSWRPIRRGEN